MEVELREKVVGAGKETAVCTAAGVTAWFLALLLGVDEGIAMFSGLIVFGAMGAVSLWSRFASGGTSLFDVAANVGSALIIIFIALFTIAIFLDRVGVMRFAFYGGIAALIAVPTAVAWLKRRC